MSISRRTARIYETASNNNRVRSISGTTRTVDSRLVRRSVSSFENHLRRLGRTPVDVQAASINYERGVRRTQTLSDDVNLIDHRGKFKINHFIPAVSPIDMQTRLELLANAFLNDLTEYSLDNNPKPLTSEEIEYKIPEFMYGEYEDKGENNSCAICLTEFSDSDMCRKLQCKHMYHSICITKWLKMRPNCALCRTRIT